MTRLLFVLILLSMLGAGCYGASDNSLAASSGAQVPTQILFSTPIPLSATETPTPIPSPPTFSEKLSFGNVGDILVEEYTSTTFGVDVQYMNGAFYPLVVRRDLFTGRTSGYWVVESVTGRVWMSNWGVLQIKGTGDETFGYLLLTENKPIVVENNDNFVAPISIVIDSLHVATINVDRAGGIEILTFLVNGNSQTWDYSVMTTAPIGP